MSNLNDTVERSEKVVADVEAKEVLPEAEPVKAEMTSEQAFQQEASQVQVPMSVAMNGLRSDINTIINRSPLHIECILEIFRSTCDALEKIADDTARKESAEYDNAIGELKKKHGVM